LKPTLLSLVGLLLVAPVALAEDHADPSTALLPARARLIVRLPSLDRLDALAGEAGPFLEMLGDELPIVRPGQAPMSDLVLRSLGLDAAAGVDRSRPMYVGIVDGDPFYVLPGSARTLWEGETALTGELVGLAKDGHLLVAKKPLLALEARGTPVRLIAGDAAVHLGLGELIAEHRERIDAEIVKWKGELPELGLGAGFDGMVGEAINLIGPTLDGLDALQYALTMRDGGLYSEGLLRTRDGTAMRKLLSEGGAPGDHDLVALLPRGAFVSGDGISNAQWGMDRLGAMIERHFGEGSADALVGLMGPAAVCNDQLTGRSAFSMSFTTMMPSTLTIYEVKDAAQADALLRAMDVAKINAACERLQLPVKMEFEPDAAVYGETKMHRLLTSTDMEGLQMPMFSQQQAYLAFVGDKLLMSSGVMAESDLKSLIDRVRSGDHATEHPHLAAMHRLCEKRSFGVTINFGAVKPMLAMVAMFAPEAGALVQAVPDEMPMSTAFVLDGGDIRWHGDWPLQGILQIAQKAIEMERAKAVEREDGKPGEEPDFE